MRIPNRSFIICGGSVVSDKEVAEVNNMIQSLFRLAELEVWEGEINDEVAAVFGIMLAETQKCSSAFKWLPKPPGGRASISWLVMQLGRGIFGSFSTKLSFVCARTVIYKWRRRLDMASAGIAAARLPKWG
jgi:hypothetical protein